MVGRKGQVRVPQQSHAVREQDAVLQRHISEVERLGGDPQHPVRPKHRPEVCAQLGQHLLSAPLQDQQQRDIDGNSAWCEQALVQHQTPQRRACAHTGGQFVHEVVPHVQRRADIEPSKQASAKETSKVKPMALESQLAQHIAHSNQDRRGRRLRQHRVLLQHTIVRLQRPKATRADVSRPMKQLFRPCCRSFQHRSEHTNS
mmetsp:Transcript_4833/g.15634  ORF Transcript_4833/g.15634 Transcript_4833/m.15634 type:complete len:202 (-) Transcript_4833:14-619(-)